MIINSILLKSFRNFRNKEFVFSDNTTIIVGDNAVGKTNILEAIFLLATGKSFKAGVEGEMIAYGEDIARIKGKVGNQRSQKTQSTAYSLQSTDLEVVLTNGEIGLHGGGVQKAQRKKLLVNGVNKRLLDFAGNLKVVLFGPWDIDLVTASPSLRRRFLDLVLSQTDREYRRSIMIYEKGLRQRNKLLLRIRDEGVSKGQLMYWDKLLIKHGIYLTNKREKFIDFCNARESLQSTVYSLQYDRSVISEGRLKQYEDEEVAAATTLVGPHRDDFIVEILNSKPEIRNGSAKLTIPSSSKDKKQIRNSKLEIRNSSSRNLAKFGSRGEARMGVLWLKLSELTYIEQTTGDKPVLLLDDIFSELDHEHRDIVMKVCNDQQTIITTADAHNIESLTGIKRINLVG